MDGNYKFKKGQKQSCLRAARTGRARVCSTSVDLDSGADLCLVESLSTVEQRLRIFDRDERSDDLYCNDSLDGSAKTDRNIETQRLFCTNDGRFIFRQ